MNLSAFSWSQSACVSAITLMSVPLVASAKPSWRSTAGATAGSPLISTTLPLPPSLSTRNLPASSPIGLLWGPICSVTGVGRLRSSVTTLMPFAMTSLIVGVLAALSCAEIISTFIPCTSRLSTSLICLAELPSALVMMSLVSGRFFSAYSLLRAVIVLRWAAFELAWLKPMMILSSAKAGAAKYSEHAAAAPSIAHLVDFSILSSLEWRSNAPLSPRLQQDGENDDCALHHLLRKG